MVRVTFGDEDTYDLFIDPRTGGLGGFRIMEDRQGRFEGFGDWRMAEGVRLPFSQTIKSEVPGGDQTVTVTSMEVNRPISPARLARPAPVRRAMFKNGASSTAWIDFEFFGGERIYFPARVNGHDTVVLLDSGATVSAIDRAYATSIGLKPKGRFTGGGTGGVDTTGFIDGMTVEVGDLTLRSVDAATFDLAPVATHIGHPLPFVLGNEVFNELAVDIDFAHHRIAFRDASRLTRPAGAVETPLVRVRDHRSVPVSVEGATPAQFEFDLGSGLPLQVYPAFYQTHRLLDGRRTSQEMGGGVGGFHPDTVATLSPVTFAGAAFKKVPAQFSPDTLSDANSNLVVGNIGLPVLARFRLVIDYSHDRLFAAPYAGAAAAPFAKDRLGLALAKQGAGFAVEFVASGSPAQMGGFKAGDKIALIDGKPAQDWPDGALAALKYEPAGVTLTFTLGGGGVRRVKLADFF